MVKTFTDAEQILICTFETHTHTHLLSLSLSQVFETLVVWYINNLFDVAFSPLILSATL